MTNTLHCSHTQKFGFSERLEERLCCSHQAPHRFHHLCLSAHASRNQQGQGVEDEINKITLNAVGGGTFRAAPTRQNARLFTGNMNPFVPLRNLATAWASVMHFPAIAAVRPPATADQNLVNFGDSREPRAGPEKKGDTFIYIYICIHSRERGKWPGFRV